LLKIRKYNLKNDLFDLNLHLFITKEDRTEMELYRVGHLAFGISTTVILSLKGVITFMTYQKFSFLFDIYEMGYTLEQNWEILKTYFQSGVFNPNCKKFTWKIW